MIDFERGSPLLVFGGPYSNVRATQALMAETARRGIPRHRVICTGDVVAYCAEPEETARALADWGCHAIRGNCEQQLADAAQDCACNFESGSACDLLAKGWYPFANARISQPMRDWMGGLPQTLRFSFSGCTFRVVHGGVSQVNRWVFASDTAVLAQEGAAAVADVVIAGHAGVPFVARTGRTVWFNPGVIGMPATDGTRDVWYGLVTANEHAFKHGGQGVYRGAGVICTRLLIRCRLPDLSVGRRDGFQHARIHGRDKRLWVFFCFCDYIFRSFTN